MHRAERTGLGDLATSNGDGVLGRNKGANVGRGTSEHLVGTNPVESSLAAVLGYVWLGKDDCSVVCEGSMKPVIPSGNMFDSVCRNVLRSDAEGVENVPSQSGSSI